MFSFCTARWRYFFLFGVIISMASKLYSSNLRFDEVVWLSCHDLLYIIDAESLVNIEVADRFSMLAQQGRVGPTLKCSV